VKYATRLWMFVRTRKCVSHVVLLAHRQQLCHLFLVDTSNDYLKNFKSCLNIQMNQGGWNADRRFDPSNLVRPSSECVMIEVGGNTGRDAADLLRIFGCTRFYIFEPLPHLYSILKDKFSTDDRVKLFNFGLGPFDHNATFYVWGNMDEGSGEFTESKTGEGIKQEVVIRSTLSVIEELGFTNKIIDLLHVNCESCEYALFEDLIHGGLLKNVKVINVGTHSPNKEIVARYCRIHEHLRMTHTLDWHQPWVWERWSSKST